MQDEALGFEGQYDSALFIIGYVPISQLPPTESFPLDRDPRSLLNSIFFVPQGY